MKKALFLLIASMLPGLVSGQQLSDIKIGFMSGTLTAESGPSLTLYGGDVISGVFSNGDISFSVGSLAASTQTATSNESKSVEIPASHALLTNFPNPFNPSTTLRFQLASAAQVTVRIFDILGREVASPVNSRKEAGLHTAAFDASRLASGVYLVVMVADGKRIGVKQITLLR
jgi:hypothetical protein